MQINPTKIYIPSDDASDFLFTEKGSSMLELTNISTTEIVRTPFLDKDGPAIKFFKETCAAWLGTKYRGIVLVIDEKSGQVMLGKF